MKKTLHIIPHSHWDREWYLPFEKHRTRLIDLLDNLIEVMEQNDDYTYYHLDGQFAVIEDYLEVRPAMKERLFSLIHAGRIKVGPWYVLQDEYLTSGESNVRNMLYGIRLCKEIGAEPVKCGYFPDAFGNISQAPQIVRGFGIDNAVFGRGVNDVGADEVSAESEIIKENGVSTSELIWRAPDGSEVIGVMFCNWYHNAMELPADPEALKNRIEKIVKNTARFATTDHLLGMNGCDHQPLQKNLHEVIKLANEVQNDVTVVQSNIEDYVDLIRKNAKDLKVFEGEINSQLTSGWGNLICTASAHIDIKQDNHDVELLLTGVAEPLSVLLKENGGKYKDDLFLYAWRTLMQNHPHDSICSCSCDEVYDEMKVRFMKARTCAEELRDYAIDKLAEAITTENADGDKAIVVFTLSPNKTTATVTANVDFPLPRRRRQKDGTITIDPRDAGYVEVKSITVYDDKGNEVAAKITRQPRAFTYTLPEDRFRQPRYVNRFVVEFPVTSEGVGYTTYTVKTHQKSKKRETPLCANNTLENEFLSVVFNQNGSFTLTDKRTGEVYPDLNLFEDSADNGDLYNYEQPEGDVAIVSDKHEAKISLFEKTPYSATYKVSLTLTKGVALTSFVTLTKGIARVDIKTTVDNKKIDHRVRALFPTNFDTKYVYAEGQFDIVERKIVPEITWKNPCNAQRMQAFVKLSDNKTDRALLLASRGLCEYEVLRDGKNTLALTLLRAIGEVGDWGVFPAPKGQKLGKYTLEYSILPYKKAEEADAYSLGYGFAYPQAVAVGCDKHAGTMPEAAQYVSFDNEYIRASALKKKEGDCTTVLRLFNTHTEAVTLTVTLGACYTEATLLTLGEDALEALTVENGKLTMTVPAKKIVTIELK